MKKRAVKVMKWIGVVILVLGLSAAVFAGFGKRALRKAYEALEADGRPMWPEQVIPAEIADSDNAALVYRAVVLQLRAEPAGEDGLLSEAGVLAADIVKGRADDEGVQRFKDLMEREPVRQAMAQLELGTLKKGCRYDLDYTAGAGLIMPHLSELRDLSRIVCAQACLAAVDGRAQESWENAIIALRLADALRKEPTLISQLVRLAQFSTTADTIQALTKECLPSKEQHTELVSLITGFEDKSPLLLALDGERLLFGEWAFDLPANKIVADMGMEAGLKASTLAVAFLTFMVRDHDHAAYLRSMRMYTMMAANPFSTAQEETLDETVLQDIPAYCLFTKMLLPALDTALTRFLASVSQARVTRAGLITSSVSKTRKGRKD